MRICRCCGGQMSLNGDMPIGNPNICAACFDLTVEMEEFFLSGRYAEFAPNQILPVAFGDANPNADLLVAKNGNNGKNVKNHNGFAGHRDLVPSLNGEHEMDEESFRLSFTSVGV
jgi:hypothetical protein